MSFFQALRKCLLKDHADGCYARKIFPQQHLSCPSLPCGSADPETQHQPLPAVSLKNNDSYVCLSCFPQNGKY